MITGATLFSGFDGVGVGMRAAGISPIWGIEQRADVAAVAERNGFHSIVADILTVDPTAMERIDCLHASPPCTNASIANSNGRESDLDQALARKTVDFIQDLKPTIFTLENVWQYRKFVSFGIILGALEALGYWVDVANCNAVDYQVPQTRKRLILRARLGGWLPHLPDPEPWIGWYEAIEDLIPTLPASEFVPWQMARLPEELATFIIGNGGRSAAVDRSEPADTITGNHNQATMRAFLMSGGGNTNFNEAHEGKGIFEAHDPAPVISANANGGTAPRAFLVDGQNAAPDETITYRFGEQPCLTLTSGSGNRAILRAWLSQGQVVKLTPRALARLQSFPDSYELPAKATLACFGIGNAVPPLMMKKIYKQMRNQ